jgi:tetrathionate reductase subunit B
MISKNTHYAMVVDLRRCVGCNACTVACKMENAVPDGFYRSWILQADKGTYPLVTRVKMNHLCNQCQNPPCVPVCPAKATQKDKGGIVTIHSIKCIGCGRCVKACPYNARYLKPGKPIADKCNFCFHRIQAGLLPACVGTCVGQALFFGDLNDPKGEISRLLALHKKEVLRPELGTNPSVFYLGLREVMQDFEYNKHMQQGPFIMTP